MNGRGNEGVAWYDASHDPRAALAVPALRRDLASQREEAAALAAELAPHQQAPAHRAGLTAALEARQATADLLDLYLGDPSCS